MHARVIFGGYVWQILQSIRLGLVLFGPRGIGFVVAFGIAELIGGV